MEINITLSEKLLKKKYDTTDPLHRTKTNHSVLSNPSSIKKKTYRSSRKTTTAILDRNKTFRAFLSRTKGWIASSLKGEHRASDFSAAARWNCAAWSLLFSESLYVVCIDVVQRRIIIMARGPVTSLALPQSCKRERRIKNSSDCFDSVKFTPRFRRVFTGIKIRDQYMIRLRCQSCQKRSYPGWIL